MNFSEIVCISNMPGLYSIHKKRNDGLIVCELPNQPAKFVSSRNHVFTPLENITIYTEDEPVELTDVFKNMKQYSLNASIPSPKEAKDILISFFREVVPNYDDENVYISDIKKVIKWYNILDENNMLVTEEKKKEAKETKKTKKTKSTKTTKATKKTVAKEKGKK